MLTPTVFNGRAVALMRAGVGPGAAAATVGASRATGYRWRIWPRAGRCASGRPRRSGSPAASAQPKPRSWPPASTVGPARSCSGRCSGGPPRPLAKCCGGSGVRDAHDCRGRRSYATSAPTRASCCTWTPRSWVASGTSASASVATASSAAHEPAGTTCMWPWTITRGWPTPRCGPVTGRPALAFLDRALLRTGHPAVIGQRSLSRLAVAARHLRTRPTPRTNGKAERFIQILLSWAYGLAYPSSTHRTRALGGWLRWYNRRRPHGSLGGRPPVSRVSHLCGQYT